MTSVAELKLALELEHAEVLLLRQERDALTAEVDRLRHWREDAEAVHEAVCADLARVTRDRDALLAAAKDIIACDKALSDARSWCPPRTDDVMVAELRMKQSLAPLRLALAACTPGEGR